MAIDRVAIERIVLVVFGLVVPAILGSSLTIFNDGDVRWHIATGQWMLDHHAVPRVDPFSFTYRGGPWIAIEWGSELIYGTAHRLAGFAGVAAVVTAALIALHMVVVANARRWVGPAGIAITVILLDLVLIPMILARPHLLGWMMLALWFQLLLNARDTDRPPPLIAAALMILWVNLHGSFAIGLLLAAVIAFDACLEANWRWLLVRGWILFGAVAGLATLINPYGVEGLLHPLTITGMKILPLIVEWQPSDFGRTPFFYVAVAVAALLMAWRGVKLRPVMATLLALLLAMALMQMRHQAILAIVAAMVLPRAMSREERPSLLGDHDQRRLALFAIVGAATFLVGFRAWSPLEPAENGANPKSAIAALPANLRAAPGLNGYGFGGPLILAGIRPYIDGRADMYGDAFVLDTQRILDGNRAAFDRASARYGLRWTILPRRYAKLNARLDSDPAWERIYADDIAIVHRRR